MGHKHKTEGWSISKEIRMGIIVFLSLSFCADVSGDQLYPFLEELITDFELIAPTMIISDDVPELCMNYKWILCLKTSNNDAVEIAKYLETLLLLRRQDAIIFSDQDGMATLIKETSPSLYKSPLPVFMPIEYASLIEHRLDSNINYYKRIGAQEFSLVEIFAVKGGKTIIQDLGSWNIKSGLQLFHSKNIWNRRTNLNGAEIVETLVGFVNYGEPQYDNGTLIGSAGLHPDRLHTFAETLNLKIKTIITYDGVGGGRKTKNGSWSGDVGMLERKYADFATSGLAYTLGRDTAIDFVDDLVPLGGYTLIGRKSRVKTLDMWVYAGVFGLQQWAAIVASLISILLSILITFSQGHHQSEVSLQDRAISGFGMVFLFVIQLGDHPQGGPNARRIIYLVTGIMTYLLYAYYTTDVTAQMTFRETEDNPFRSFADVLQNPDIKIITVKGTSYDSHIRSSLPGSAKYQVYKDRMENREVWYSTAEAAKDAVLSDPNTFLYAYHSEAHSPPGLKALKMADTSIVSGGIGLQKDSEFQDIFHYLLIKFAEVGILKRINMKWPDTSRNEDFGLPEPGSLAFSNILFPFTSLLTGIITASAFACLEYVLKRYRKEAKGPYIKDVRIRRGEGGNPTADIVREVAWI